MNDLVIIPLDVPTRKDAMAIVGVLGDAAGFYKVGLELFSAEGPDVVRELRALGKDVFLDLKLHDIPDTVAKAVSRCRGLGVRFLTVHASGGDRMLRAAQEAAEGRVTLLGVTVLTSFDREGIGTVFGRPVDSVEDEVGRLAELVAEAELGGVVCSAHEAGRVRALVGPGLEIVTPGIRLAGDAHHDQKRVRTPAEAIRDGATRLVVGRSVTAAADPVRAYEAVVAEASGAMAGAP